MPRLACPPPGKGKRSSIQITAVTRYFQTGTTLRVRTGLDVCEADKSQLQAAIITGVAFADGAHVHVFVRRTPRIKFAFPGPIGEVVPDGVEPTVELLWLPGDPCRTRSGRTAAGDESAPEPSGRSHWLPHRTVEAVYGEPATAFVANRCP